jgi:chromosome segregation ATPase
VVAFWTKEAAELQARLRALEDQHDRDLLRIREQEQAIDAARSLQTRMRTLEMEHDRDLLRIGEQEQAINAARSAGEASRRELASVSLQLSERDTDVRILTESLAQTRQALVRLRASFSEGRQETETLRQAVVALSSRMQALERSLSWRMTAPIRRVGTAVRRVRRTLRSREPR